MVSVFFFFFFFWGEVTVVWLTNHSDKSEGESQQTDNGGVGEKERSFGFSTGLETALKELGLMLARWFGWKLGGTWGGIGWMRDFGRIVLECKIRPY